MEERKQETRTNTTAAVKGGWSWYVVPEVLLVVVNLLRFISSFIFDGVLAHIIRSSHIGNTYSLTIILFLGDSVRSFFSPRPQYAIRGTGILGQIASFESRPWGAAPTSLAPTCSFYISTSSRIDAARDKPEVRYILNLGGIRPSYGWILAYVGSSNE